MSSVVLDASAVLAVMHRERGHEKVMPHLEGGLISAVNYAEVLKKVAERGADLLVARLYLQNLTLTIVPFDQAQAVETAKLWPLVQGRGLSLADRACLALGILKKAPIVTGDTGMAEVDVPVKVKLFR